MTIPAVMRINPNTGVRKSDECRAKMRKARLGKKHTPETIEKIRASVKAQRAANKPGVAA